MDNACVAKRRPMVSCETFPEAACALTAISAMEEYRERALCPYCGVTSVQTVKHVLYFRTRIRTGWWGRICGHCGNVAVWRKKKLLLPSQRRAQQARSKRRGSSLCDGSDRN